MANWYIFALSKMHSRSIKNVIGKVKRRFTESVWCWKGMCSRTGFVCNFFSFFMIQTDCISSSKANDAQAEISRCKGRGWEKAQFSVLEIYPSVCMSSPERQGSPTFFFSGVLARYAEYQSLSLREKPEQRLDINKLVFSEELSPAGATNCWFWTRLYPWQPQLEEKNLNSRCDFFPTWCASVESKKDGQVHRKTQVKHRQYWILVVTVAMTISYSFKHFHSSQ